MKTNDAFLMPDSPMVTAAMLGISKLRWESTVFGTTLSEAAEIMARHRFDVLPVQNSQLQVIGYFQKENKGPYTAENLVYHDLTSTEEQLAAPQIYYLTTLDDLVQQFVKTGHFFFFLTNHEEIIGMVSQVHLRSRASLLYLYGHLVNLERALAEWIKQIYTEQELMDFLLKQANDDIDHMAYKSVQAFQQERDEERENQLVEYLYLSTLLNLIRWLGWVQAFGYASNTVFNDEVCKPVIRLRNQVDHPVRDSLTPQEILHFLQLSTSLLGKIDELMLFSAYYQTVYVVDEPALTIRIGQRHPELDQLLAKHGHSSWMYITAWNPLSVQYSAAENALRNNALKYELEQAKYPYFPARGQPCQPSNWIPEESFLVLSPDCETAQNWGNRFGQKAIIWGKQGQIAELLTCQDGTSISLPF